jgi:uncharacterized protein YbjQ (UPF0145 family)
MKDVVDAPDPRLARLDRLRGSSNWSFGGPVSGFGAAAIAGFEPVGQVFGATVVYPALPGLGNCFVPATASAKGDARTSANPHNRLLVRLREARELAVERAVMECRALGGDGIIGMRMSVAKFFTDTLRFTVEGTAVRTRSQTRPDTPFTTHVSGQDLVKLLRSGWMPFSFVFGMAIAACHFDQTMFQQTRRGVGVAANREVSGYTRLVNEARRQARRTLEDAVHAQGGDGAVVHEMTLHISERECPLTEQRTDYLAEAMILGSALIALDRNTSADEPAPLTIMRLDGRAAASAGAESGLGPGPNIYRGPTLGDRAFAYWSGRRSGA